jgi:hypothetical protein
LAAFPTDVLIVEDDPIIALDFEDTIIGFGVKTVRTAASVARALLELCDTARLQKGRFHVAILSESRRGRHAPNVRSTAPGEKNQWRMMIAPG